ncbi:MAG TPA: sulfurtransferase TusA family protein [Clostridia bacterium]|nr:sulfurtransferase TusA family protein [Clostridia bacterium]
MAKTIDARGLLCPEPVLLTKRELDKINNGTLKVLVDNTTSRENVTRFAENQGWSVQLESGKGEYVLTLSKS